MTNFKESVSSACEGCQFLDKNVYYCNIPGNFCYKRSIEGTTKTVFDILINLKIIIS